MRLNIGADIECDFGKQPMDDGSVDEIFLELTIEKVPMWRYEEVFGEWKRILKAGGILSGISIDAEEVLMGYADGKIGLDGVIDFLFGKGTCEGDQHFMTFSTKTLAELLRRMGFDSVQFSDVAGPMRMAWTCKKA